MVASTIFHCQEYDKVPSGNLFYVLCPTQTEVRLYLPFAIVLYLSGMDLGSAPSTRICEGYYITRLALPYKVGTSGMVPICILEMGTATIGKIRVLVLGEGYQWRILDYDIVEPLQPIVLEDIPKPVFVRRQRPSETTQNTTQNFLF